MQEKPQPSQEEIAKAEPTTNKQRETAEQHETDLAVREMREILEHAKAGQLTIEDARIFDELLQSLIHPPLKALLASPEEIEAVRQSTIGKIYIEMFSDPRSLATLKEFAIRAYEVDALQDAESDSFHKLRVFANAAELLGGDRELADRFSVLQGEPREITRVITEEDAKFYKAIGIDYLNAGDAQEVVEVPKPIWSYKK